MDTKQIINGLLDRADRVADQSAGRIMRQAAKRLEELEERTKHKPAPELMPMGALTYAIACSHCGNRNKDAETCRKCKCEIESGFEVDPINGWIPATERLPDELSEFLCRVICPIPGGKYVRENRILWCDYGNEWNCEGLIVTHWMPLPEPPKEVDHES